MKDILEERIRIICLEVDATEDPLIFLTSSKEVLDIYNNYRKLEGEEPLEHQPLFRYGVAKLKPYKGTRANRKPFHFRNIIVHLLSSYPVYVSPPGLEADDSLSSYQFGRSDTVICSRDKDLRICPGWHYSWECGRQAAIGPTKTDDLGFLVHTPVKKGGKNNNVISSAKTIGYGKTFFYYQCLVGDIVDNISGLPGCGDANARKILEGATSEEDLYQRVFECYQSKYGDEAEEQFIEQANLLWLHQKEWEMYKPPCQK